MKMQNQTANPKPETASTIPPASFKSVEMPKVDGMTQEKVEAMGASEVIALYGNKSNAIRALSALGMKPGPISKKLGILYQHARNVLSRPLKRVIKEERDAKATLTK